MACQGAQTKLWTWAGMKWFCSLKPSMEQIFQVGNKGFSSAVLPAVGSGNNPARGAWVCLHLPLLIPTSLCLLAPAGARAAKAGEVSAQSSLCRTAVICELQIQTGSQGGWGFVHVCCYLGHKPDGRGQHSPSSLGVGAVKCYSSRIIPCGFW